jgi:Tfp pilus assembly protein PilF|tara:strand:- start:874 stop:1314 length:441 start_codon:yes stop_codon:yes gene_type:complete
LKKIKFLVIFSILIGLISCATDQQSRDPSSYSVPVNNFTQTVELLISNDAFLQEEILKINAQNPSVQRILLDADKKLRQQNYRQANIDLERAFRITKSDGALYLRLAHLRYKQGLLRESESFASKGLLLSNISSWERLLLNVYLKN